ncbi:MAG: hypothetical protein KDD56_07920, partial [Bdellovibrionales bacterium]|nr:hypothetical protein [Bdellovibrionales bacterium]
ELSVEEKIVRVIELHFTDRLLHSDLYFSEFKISRSTSYHRPPLMEYLPESIWMYNRSVNDQTLHTREIETLNAICYARNSEAYLLYRKNRTPYNEWVDDLINEIKDKLKEKRDYLKYANSVDDSPDKSNFIKDVNQDIKYLAYCLRAVTLNKMQILDFFSPSPQ